MKTCSKCKVEKPLCDFYKRSDTGRPRSDCKKCCNNRSAKRWKEDKDFRKRGKQRSRAHQIRELYGLTMEQADAIYSRGCEVCGTDKNLCIDHCHSTKEIRGCLCSKCNSGIGMLGDTEEDVWRAYAYLVRYRKRLASG